MNQTGPASFLSLCVAFNKATVYFSLFLILAFGALPGRMSCCTCTTTSCSMVSFVHHLIDHLIHGLVEVKQLFLA